MDTPVAVTDAALTLLMVNPMYQALLGDTSGARGPERNGAWGGVPWIVHPDPAHTGLAVEHQAVDALHPPDSHSLGIVRQPPECRTAAADHRHAPDRAAPQVRTRAGVKRAGVRGGVRRWPVHPEPGPGEALPSWFGRLASLYRLSVEQLLTHSLGSPDPPFATPWPFSGRTGYRGLTTSR